MNNSKYLEKEFFKFVFDRHLIWYKRFVLKEEHPWTEDKVLKTYKIINVYRELDKCTRYILQKLKGIKNREKLLINIIFYRFFNQFNLYEDLEIEPFEKIDEDVKTNLVKNFERIKNQGHPLFNNAYLISSGKKGEKKHISILNYLEELDLGIILNKLDSSKTPRESLEVLQQIPMVGPFLACEIWTDLTYFKFFKQRWTDNDFVNIGPGAKWGLEIIYNQKLSKKEQEEKLKQLYKIQKVFLGENWKKIAYKDAFSNYPFLSITNIEGSLCEFRKYWRIKAGKGRRKYFFPMNR
jgi:hypothetical protein